MSGSVYGTMFRVSTWGESHGKGVGVVVDGCPAGLPLCEEDIQKYLDRRKPGQSKYTTPRKEDDAVEILSGIFEGKTTGTPISMVVYNKTQRSADYSEIAGYYRPGHADYTFDEKYGFRDYRGGGRSSGRETIARVAAGAIACKLLESLGIDVLAYTRKIGGIEISDENFDREEILRNPVCMPDAQAAVKVEELLDRKLQEHDSVGGVIECRINGMPAGVGEPVFEKLNANLGKAIMSIGAVKGFEIGDGFAVADSFGSVNNDEFYYDEDGNIKKHTNHGGGIYGGISDGSEIVFRAAIKPTPSIAKLQNTVNKSGDNIEISIKGRHDPIIVPRAVVVVECMAAIALVDMLFASMTSKLEDVVRFFS
ncbi:MAG: chorismate synthase [Lachnospiraceae bacterium]|nr:chorismate synthase [Lachnospiraceae bacterium]